MRNDLDRLLCERYPKIFPLHDSDVQRSTMAWGFECGDGWFDLIDDLCSRMQPHVDSSCIDQIIALQVKEKYGELRFYHNSGDEMIHQMVEEAEARSEQICEQCGQPGALTETLKGWLQTRCFEHSFSLSSR